MRLVFQLTITAALLRRALERADNRPLELALGVRRTPDGVELFAPTPALMAPGDTPLLRIARFPSELRGASHLYWYGFALRHEPIPRVDLGLYEGGGCSAAVLLDGEVHPLDEVRIAGPRMELWYPGRSAPEPRDEVPRSGAFSRYAGALGGEAVHARLRALSAAVIGVSRLGSPLALALAKAGLRRLVLVDPDRVEAHHLDAMEVLGARAIGRAKVDAVAELLREVAPECEVEPRRAALDAPAALAAVADCRLLVTAPDRGQPRLLAALAASAYHRPHLDVGTAVQRADDALDAGADVRLALPGEPCLLCTGGIAVERRPVADWREERAGSLRSLNALATAQAIFLLERLVAGDVATTTWVRLDLDRAGALRVERPSVAGRPGCPLCAVAGAGDAVWRRGGQPGSAPLSMRELRELVGALVRERHAR